MGEKKMGRVINLSIPNLGKENILRNLSECLESGCRTAYKRGKGADASPSQLLCALQQLCVGIPF